MAPGTRGFWNRHCYFSHNLRIDIDGIEIHNSTRSILKVMKELLFLQERQFLRICVE